MPATENTLDESRFGHGDVEHTGKRSWSSLSGADSDHLGKGLLEGMVLADGKYGPDIRDVDAGTFLRR